MPHSELSDGTNEDLHCPSASPDMMGATAIGVVGGTVEQPRVRYLDRPVPVSADLLKLAHPVDPREVFRFGAVCAGTRCMHFNQNRCQLVEQIVNELAPVVAAPPACSLRVRCRWWAQEGVTACLRCPLIVTLRQKADPAIAAVVRPTVEHHS